MKLPGGMKWGDMLIVALALSLAALALLWTGEGERAGYAVVRIDNEQAAELALDVPGEYEFSSENGVNVVEVLDGGVRIKSADCPDGYCVRQGFIYESGQTLICLPHRLTVELHSARKSTLDDIAS